MVVLVPIRRHETVDLGGGPRPVAEGRVAAQSGERRVVAAGEGLHPAKELGAHHRPERTPVARDVTGGIGADIGFDRVDGFARCNSFEPLPLVEQRRVDAANDLADPLGDLVELGGAQGLGDVADRRSVHIGEIAQQRSLHPADPPVGDVSGERVARLVQVAGDRLGLHPVAGEPRIGFEMQSVRGVEFLGERLLPLDRPHQRLPFLVLDPLGLHAGPGLVASLVALRDQDCHGRFDARFHNAQHVERDARFLRGRRGPDGRLRLGLRLRVWFRFWVRLGTRYRFRLWLRPRPRPRLHLRLFGRRFDRLGRLGGGVVVDERREHVDHEG